MTIYRTGSSNTINVCHVYFGFLPAKYQIFIPTAKFLQKFIASENSLRTLFVRWLGSRVAKALDLQPAGCEFNSQPRRCRVTTLGKLFTPMCLCHQAV